MPRPVLALVLLALFSSVLFGQQQQASPQKTVVIHAANLIDGKSAELRHNVTIVITGNKIESIRETGTAPAGATVINFGPEQTVLPGLIDTHTHIFLQGEDPAEGGYDIQLLKHPVAFRAARATVSARRALEEGFTTL
ncbi:MAG TPA: hypothetical protein VLN58_11150, partial [Verrucomicrobiae bacterium]|nr:hypothetical protein [Verrucomicrobiae bacterium]